MIIRINPFADLKQQWQKKQIHCEAAGDGDADHHAEIDQRYEVGRCQDEKADNQGDIGI